MSTIEIKARPYVGRHRATQRPSLLGRALRWVGYWLGAGIEAAVRLYDRAERVTPPWYVAAVGSLGFVFGWFLVVLT